MIGSLPTQTDRDAYDKAHGLYAHDSHDTDEPGCPYCAWSEDLIDNPSDFDTAD